MTYKSFAFVGLGNIGSAILAEFIKEQEREGLTLRVLTRDSAKKAALYKGKNVKFVEVDYSSHESIRGALEGVDVVLSTLRNEGLNDQKKVIPAAKEAGVKLFVPSEFGVNSQRVRDEYLEPKYEAHALLSKNDLPCTLFFIGFFPEVFVKTGPQLGLNFEKGDFILFGDAPHHRPLSWTSVPSVASYVRYVLTTLPPSDLENKIFNIEGERKTWREIIQVWEHKDEHRKANVHPIKDEDIGKYQAEHPDPFLIFMSNVFRDKDAGVNGGEANALFPAWKPKKWQDIMP